MLTDYYFWFTQPSSFLSQIDKVFIYSFFGLLLLAIAVRLIKRFIVKNQIDKKLLQKFWSLFFTVGFSGVMWAVFRYENTPIFARRYWAGLSFAIGIIWILFILKYLISDYRREKLEYEKELLKNKYIPKAK